MSFGLKLRLQRLIRRWVGNGTSAANATSSAGGSSTSGGLTATVTGNGNTVGTVFYTPLFPILVVVFSALHAL